GEGGGRVDRRGGGAGRGRRGVDDRPAVEVVLRHVVGGRACEALTGRKERRRARPCGPVVGDGDRRGHPHVAGVGDHVGVGQVVADRVEDVGSYRLVDGQGRVL